MLCFPGNLAWKIITWSVKLWKTLRKNRLSEVLLKFNSVMCDGWGFFELIWLFGSAWKMRYGTDSVVSHRGSGTAGQGLIHFAQAKESLLWITVGAVPRRRRSLLARGYFSCIYSLPREKDRHFYPHSYRPNTWDTACSQCPVTEKSVCSLSLDPGGFHRSRGHITQPVWRGEFLQRLGHWSDPRTVSSWVWS